MKIQQTLKSSPSCDLETALKNMVAHLEKKQTFKPLLSSMRYKAATLKRIHFCQPSYSAHGTCIFVELFTDFWLAIMKFIAQATLTNTSPLHIAPMALCLLPTNVEKEEEMSVLKIQKHHMRAKTFLCLFFSFQTMISNFDQDER